MAKKSNLTNIAKKSSSKTTTARRGRPAKTTPEKPLNDKDAKAKETVEKLLKDVDLSPKQKEVVTEEYKKIEGSDWLEEQVTKLTEENEKLRKDADEAKLNYKKIFEAYESVKSGNGPKANANLIPDSENTNNIKSLFNELQKNMLGLNQERRGYSDIKIKHLLVKLEKMFPFVKEIKRF